jgi:hypothetical protein
MVDGKGLARVFVSANTESAALPWLRTKFTLEVSYGKQKRGRIKGRILPQVRQA